MESVILNKNETDKTVLKNIANFFHESMGNFKSTLTELSVSINNFLKSLEDIENQLNNQGFHHHQSSSNLLFERLTKGKQEREMKQKEMVSQLISKPETIIKEKINLLDDKVQQITTLKPPPKAVLTPKPNIIKAIKEPDQPISVKKERPPVLINEIKQTDSGNKKDTLVDLKKEMLDNLKKIKIMMKSQ